MYMSASTEERIRESVFRVVAEWAGRKAEEILAHQKLHQDLKLDEHCVSGVAVELSDLHKISFLPDEILKKNSTRGTRGVYTYQDIDVGELCRLAVEKVDQKFDEQPQSKRRPLWQGVRNLLGLKK
jgi:hypothetical protein